MMNRNLFSIGSIAVKGIYNSMTEEEREKACLIVSAHRLPEKIIAIGDPYPDQLNETADFIARSCWC